MIFGSVAEMATDGQVYPPAVHTKFSPDGNPLRYPGNTTVCHIPAESPVLLGLWDVYNTIASHPTLSKRFRLLPPDSWHMTVFDGVREEEAEPGMWPEGLEKLPLDECTRNFSKTIKDLGLSLMAEGLAPPYKMRVNGFQFGQFGMALDIVGATDEEDKRMSKAGELFCWHWRLLIPGGQNDDQEVDDRKTRAPGDLARRTLHQPPKPRSLVHGYDRRMGLAWAADSLTNAEAENGS
ncbi:unnamed protein product [Fusarium fujikuroi]|nr:unnamed protein product [Fusarium fujikuroi]